MIPDELWPNSDTQEVFRNFNHWSGNLNRKEKMWLTLRFCGAWSRAQDLLSQTLGQRFPTDVFELKVKVTSAKRKLSPRLANPTKPFAHDPTSISSIHTSCYLLLYLSVSPLTLFFTSNPSTTTSTWRGRFATTPSFLACAQSSRLIKSLSVRHA